MALIHRVFLIYSIFAASSAAASYHRAEKEVDLRNVASLRVEKEQESVTANALSYSFPNSKISYPLTLVAVSHLRKAKQIILQQGIEFAENDKKASEEILSKVIEKKAKLEEEIGTLENIKLLPKRPFSRRSQHLVQLAQ